MLHSLLAHYVLSASLFAAPAPDDAAVRAEVGKSLESLASSILAADPASYLARVASDDHEFYNEQKYFANDFKKKPPAAVKYEIGEGEIKIEAAAVELPLVVTWTMPEKKERTVSYRARFVTAGGAGGAGGAAEATPRNWLYAGETWATSEAPGIVVMHDPGLDELAAKTVEAFTAVRAHVEDVFNLAQAELPRKTQKIKIYGKMKHLQASICLSYEDGLSGWNEPGEPIKLLASPRSTVKGLMNLLAHEYGHVATFELGPTSNEMPWWILEGVAEFSALKFSGNKAGRDRTVARWFADDKIAPWKEISDFENTPDRWHRNVYTQGHSMVAFVDEAFGKEKRIEWMTVMSNGANMEEGTKEALGLSFAELDERWREKVKGLAEEEKKKEAERKEKKEREEKGGE